MVPPEALFRFSPSPVTVKLPLVLLNMIPFEAPFDETLVSDTARGVVPLLRVMFTATPLPVLSVPAVVVMVLELFVASMPVWFETVLVMFNVPSEMVPLLPTRLTAAAVELVTLVVPVTVKLPLTLLAREIPLAAPLAETPCNVKVPLVTELRLTPVPVVV